jgi:hypothetical protein
MQDEELAEDALTPEKFPGFDCRRYNGSSGQVEHDVSDARLATSFQASTGNPCGSNASEFVIKLMNEATAEVMAFCLPILRRSSC